MKKRVLCMAAFLAFSVTLFAGERPGAFSLSPFGGGYTFSDDQHLSTGPVLGLRLGYDITKHWSPEITADYAFTQFENAFDTKHDAGSFSYRLDMLYNFMPDGMAVPYLAAGVGGIYIRYPELVNDLHKSNVTLNIGGGLKCFLTRSFALRGDARYLALPGDNTMSNWEYTLGLSFLFGGKKPPPTAMTLPEPAPVPEASLAPLPATEPTRGSLKYCVNLHIEFDIDKAEIRPQYYDSAARVGDFMKMFPTTTAIIEGYSDEVGTDEYNIQLSQRRAESVVNYLREQFGIDSSRISATGYGKTRPIADNSTEEGKQKNRRIRAIIDCALNVSQISKPPEQLCMTLNVEFGTDSAEIKSAFFEEINKVGDYMNKYSMTTAVIEGHTDNSGALEYNMQLSQQRAQSVVDYLADKFGIDRSRLSAKGYGPTRRIAYNTTPEGRQKNRRINAIIDCIGVK